MTRSEILEQIGILLGDSKCRRTFDLLMQIVEIERETHLTRMLNSEEFGAIRFNQGGVRALARLTTLNGEIQKALKPATPEE